jgi:hypothetical protein
MSESSYQTILRDIFMIGYPTQRKWDLMPVANRHIQVWLEVSWSLRTMINLAYDLIIIAEYLYSFVPEKMWIQFNEFQQSQQAGIFAFLVAALELGPERNAKIGDYEADQAVIARQVLKLPGMSVEEAFHSIPLVSSQCPHIYLANIMPTLPLHWRPFTIYNSNGPRFIPAHNSLFAI